MTLFVGEVRGPSGEIMEPHFELTVDDLREGVAWMRCPECRGHPLGYCLPDDRYQPCNHCKGRRVVPVMV